MVNVCANRSMKGFSVKTFGVYIVSERVRVNLIVSPFNILLDISPQISYQCGKITAIIFIKEKVTL